MSYIDAFLDRKKDQIYIAERVNGVRNLRTVPANHVFYHEDPTGQHRSIFGHTCRKFSSQSSHKFHAALKDYQRRGIRTFESDINAVFRYLADHYTGADVPTISIGFFDIEADFHPTRGFAPTNDPFNAVTAITLYRSADQKLLSWVLRPPTVTQEAAQSIAGGFRDTLMFDDEAALLEAFLDAIEDVDCLSGWNCLPKNQSVWLSDRIVALGDLRGGEETTDYGKVLEYHDSGSKKLNQITLDNGQKIEASDEHIIPIFSKKRHEYARPSTLLKSESECSVGELRSRLQATDDDIYMEVKLRSNGNPSYTYRQFMVENINAFLAVEDYDIAITSILLRDKVRDGLRQTGTLKDRFKHSRYVSSFHDYPSIWTSKSYPEITIDDLIYQLSSEEYARFVFQGNRSFSVKLDDVIPDEIFQVLGLQFTDGTYYRANRSFTLYSKYPSLLEFYKKVIKNHYNMKEGADGTISMANDGCASFDYRRGSVFGLIALMIYDTEWNKKINTAMLSRLSYSQFTAFISGLLDGDGCVSQNHITICNYDDAEHSLHELLLWNGVYASVSTHHVRICVNTHNQTFIESLNVQHPDRMCVIQQLCYYSVHNCSNAKLRKFILEGRALIRVRNIVETSEIVQMADIQTERSFFHARGIRVHNSSAYDVPYLVNRVKRVIGVNEIKRFCLWDQTPSAREYIDKFGKTVMTYDFVGRVHLDYIELYRKHNTQQRLSYALNAIGEIEVGETKTPYEGTLDDLYKKDLLKFIEYNRQDVMLMVKIDQKNKFIELSNQIAHANCVLLKTTMGAVALIDQAIINEMHEMGRVVPNRKPRDEGSNTVAYNDDDEDDDDRTPIVGAYVAQPKKGLHKHVGAIDINSLYPSAIRALNMSPETLVGQVRLDETMKLIEERAAKLSNRAEAWEGVFKTLEVQHMHKRDDAVLTVDFIDNLTDTITTKMMTGAELHSFVFDDNNHVCITANGTIFRTDVEGMIPLLLTKWYAERKSLQKQMREWIVKRDEAQTDAEREDAKRKIAFYDQRQYVKKIILNSTYGALLQQHALFFDERLGQSVTLSGRSIAIHMNATVNQVITGEYDYKGDAIIAVDTDSSYFSAYEVLKDHPDYENFDWSRENIIEMYDLIADETNATFAPFMQKTFNTSFTRGNIIRAGRELVASSGLFIKKKKYGVLIYDLEGKRLDKDGKPGKLKAMGLDLKRSDTPRFMQQFLETLLMDVLTGKPKDDIYESIRQFRRLFKDRPGWEKGAPKKVANLGAFDTKRKNASAKGLLAPMQRGEKLKINMPGHVLASLNWNTLCDLYNDRHATRITDSARIIVCKLLKNCYDMTSIAYPIDEAHLPQWFRDLPFDHTAMETTIIDNKLDNLVGVLNWDLTDTREKAGNEFFSF